MSVIPLSIGTLLWAAATAFLLEEAFHSGRFDVATLATPILTAATVSAAVLAHMRLREWRLIGGMGFLLLALLGSTIMATGTLGRLAEAKDTKEAGTQAGNRTFGFKVEDLKTAKADAKRECSGGVGAKCERANARVDALTRELSGIVVRSTDPKADSIARLAVLVGGNGARVREVVAAFDPVLLPLFLELGSVGFFAGAFKHRKAITVVQPLPETPVTCRKAFTRDEALTDFRRMKHTGSQKFLADRWQVSEGAVSKWMKAWEGAELAKRNRVGKERPALALPSPSR